MATRSDRGLVSRSGRSVIEASGGRRVDVLGEVGLGDLDELGEGRRVVDRELGEHAAVDLDTRGLEALDEAVVGHALGADRSVDALDPQPAEVTLARLAVAVVVGERVGDLLLGLAVQARTLAAVAAGALEGCPALLVGVDRPLDACHVLSPLVGAAYLPSSFLIPGASAAETALSSARRRVRRLDLPSKRCRRFACSRMSLPLPVVRKRFLAPECVLFFGMVFPTPGRARARPCLPALAGSGVCVAAATPPARPARPTSRPARPPAPAGRPARPPSARGCGAARSWRRPASSCAVR